MHRITTWLSLVTLLWLSTSAFAGGSEGPALRKTALPVEQTPPPHPPPGPGVTAGGGQPAPAVSPSRADRRLRALGGVAASHIYDDEGSLGRGPAFSAGFGYALSPVWSVELLVVRSRHVRDTTGFRWETQPLSITARVLREFGRGRVRPFAGGGGGLVHVSGSTQERLLAGPAPAQPIPGARYTWRSTGFAWDVGGGAVVDVNERWFVRPEMRIVAGQPAGTNPGTEAPYSTIQWGIGAGVRW